MVVKVYTDAVQLGKAAASYAAAVINQSIASKGKARIVLSTGASQFELFKALAGESVTWDRVEAFHLDEYIGLPLAHKASFRKYLKERFVDVLHPGKMLFVETEGNVEESLKRLSGELTREPIDLGFIGIGENAHIAFNDPPADFVTEDPYIIVNLNDTCKDQQVREGWFATREDVPKQAVSMSVNGILRCERIISCVPGAVKARAVLNTLTSDVSPDVPATKLREHRDVTLFLDGASSGLLSAETKAHYEK